MRENEIQNAPKVFCENITVAYTPEFFAIRLLSGNEGDTYVVTPQHMKRLQQYLTHQVGEYEKEFGNVDAKWEPGIVSPLQGLQLPKPPESK